MHIHFLGICGTFMGSLALLAQQMGHKVTGCDANVYPPMSDVLQENGITLIEGYGLDQLHLKPDLYVVGNALSRGNPLVEAVLNARAPYTSGPGWLSREVLNTRWVLAVAGTHGKTTTTSLLLHLLKQAGLAPGFLVGGVPIGESRSADLGETDFFVIEADEYDTAFFDKRSKFVHYHPNTLIINNLEYDHADIFPSVAAIQTQFHHLMRVVPSEGLVIYPQNTPNINAVFDQGCWTPKQAFALCSEANAVDATATEGWHAKLLAADGSEFAVYEGQTCHGSVKWTSIGHHNVMNALAGILAARHVGVPVVQSLESLASFAGVKRRLEIIGNVNEITLYDDFAHHPTAIQTTLAGLRAKIQGQKHQVQGSSGRVLAIIEPRSNTMRCGHHKESLRESVADADRVWWFEPPRLNWDFKGSVAAPNASVLADTNQIIDAVAAEAKPQDHIVIMSNGGFEGLHQRLLDVLSSQSVRAS